MTEQKSLSQLDFARFYGVSQPMVSKYVRLGKIPPECIVVVGKYKQILVDCAVAALEKNLDRIVNHEGRNDRKKRAKTHGLDAKQCEGILHPEKQVQKIKEAGRELVSLNEAQTIKANYDALLKELEFTQKSGELLHVDDVKKTIADIILTARGKILSIKGQIAPLLKEFVPDSGNFGMVMDRVESEINDILDEMAAKNT